MMLSGPCFGQNDPIVKYEQKDIRFGIMARGKVVGFQFIEDVLHFNTTGGLELRFLNYHSIGADWVYFRIRTENETFDSSKESHYDNGYSDHNLRNYWNFDYRFYGNFWSKTNSTVVPYLSLFTKIGHHYKWNQYKSVFSRYASYNHYSSFKEYGIAAGLHLGFGATGRGGLDVNIGVVKGYYNLHYDLMTSEPNFKRQRWKPHMRVNFYFNLFKV